MLNFALMISHTCLKQGHTGHLTGKPRHHFAKIFVKLGQNVCFYEISVKLVFFVGLKLGYIKEKPC